MRKNSHNQTAPKKLWRIIKTIFKPDYADALSTQECLNINGMWSLFCLLGVGLGLVSQFLHPSQPPLMYDLLWSSQLLCGSILGLGWLIAKFRPTAVRPILAVQGILFLVLPAVYVGFMHQVLFNVVQGQSFRVSHAPGLLATSGGYGMWLMVQHSDLRVSPPLARLPILLPQISFVLGGLGDAYVVYLMLQTFFSR
jgi:hypothetical protein